MKGGYTKPTMVIDSRKAEANISRMVAKLIPERQIFRPHFKTHQSAEIAEIFRKYDVKKITVSSAEMAGFFAQNGWNDITIAFPVNLREAVHINKLAGQVKLNLLLDSVYVASELDSSLTEEAGVFIEIDNGYRRSGLLPDKSEEINAIVHFLATSSNLEFKGFLTHAGNTYSARGKEEVLTIMDDTAQKLNSLKAYYLSDFPGTITSYGDTPSCSMANDLSQFDEIRPGNFVYYDVMQYHIGSCDLEDIAVAVACPVVEVYPERNELVIYGGAVHLSKEFIEGDGKFRLFGYVVDIRDDGWGRPIPGAYVYSISQEHGLVKMPAQDISAFKPGDVVGILPIHSCLTANLLKEESVII
jgi:D-serine deaminase-like pyridoxal phosphate-dependent protein